MPRIRQPRSPALVGVRVQAFSGRLHCLLPAGRQIPGHDPEEKFQHGKNRIVH